MVFQKNCWRVRAMRPVWAWMRSKTSCTSCPGSGWARTKVIRLVQAGEPAGDHLRRRADERVVVQAEEDDGAGIAVGQPGADLALVHPHGPGDAGHAADALEVGV